MAMQAGDRKYTTQERTLKDLAPNIAALLCYVGGWITGIIFLVLEQKDRTTRFHALQSIFVFGALSVAGAILGNIPYIGPGFSAIIGITGFILWIILIVKAATSSPSGELFKMPWAGNLAERLANETGSNTPQPSGERSKGAASQAPVVEEIKAATNSAAERPSTRSKTSTESFYDKYYSYRQRSGRLVSSAFAIAWSTVLLIFFNFYNQYIAYYEPARSGGTTQWQMHTLVTSDFSAWLPVVTAALVISIIGHAIAITFDKYWLRQMVRTVLDVMGAVSAITLLAIFPFDFSSLPGTMAADGTTLGLTITLIFITVCCGISALVNLIQLIVHSVRGEY